MSNLTLEALVKLENDGWASLCDSRGGDFYGTLMIPDAVMVLVNGMVLDRQTIVDTSNNSPEWDSYEISDARLVPVGPDAAALVYRARSARNEEPAFEALMSSVYCLVDGRGSAALQREIPRRSRASAANLAESVR